MNLLKVKSRACTRIVAIIVTLLVFLSLAFTAFMMIFEGNKVNFKQGFSEIENGVLDFSSSNVGNKYQKHHLFGTYDFYYNHWIVEENYLGEPDARVEVPHRWKGMELNGKKLDNRGYASYRITIKGIPIGTLIYFSNNNFIGAFYGYINGQLIYQYGTRQKEGESSSKGYPETNIDYIVDSNEPLEVVFEVSSSKQGGLSSPPRLYFVYDNKNNLWSSPGLTNIIGLFALGITLSLFIFSFILNFESVKGKRCMTFPIVMLAMTLLTVFSIDTYWRLLSFVRVNSYNIIMDANFFINLALLGALFLHFVKNKIIKQYKSWLVYISAVSVASIVLYFTLMGTFWQIIAPILQVICFTTLVYPIMIGVMQGRKSNVLYVFFILSISIYLICTAFDLINIIANGLEQAMSFLLLFINFFVMILYRRTSVETSQKLIRALQTENEHNSIKAEALKAQIKPHFIFNSLSNIQAAYRQDQNLGDHALTLFSNHLRANVDSAAIETVMFSTELENIMNYVELENMRRTQPVTVLLDCMDIDFRLPILSLQPFIENAFKHSQIDNLPNGFIEIITTETTSDFIVSINDNGVGFDQKTVKSTSVGLKNACERLHLISSATVDIISAKGKGTQIRIHFPKEKKSKENKSTTQIK